MVVNAVVLENMNTAMQTMTSLSLQPDVIQVQVNRGHALPGGTMLRSHNPVWIITGLKKEREQHE